MPQVNPEILVWARETAGLSLEDAATALHLGGARQSGTDVLGSYELGAKEPSRPLLLKMVKQYRRPLLTFYLPSPPVRSERGEDFRTLPGERKEEAAPRLDALVRDVFVRQRLVQSILEDADTADPLPFVGSITLQHNVADAAQLIRSSLSFDLKEFRRRKTIEDAFSYLRSLTERVGVFVLLMGNLGTHHTAISAEVFRGFALSERVAPFVVINDQDAKVAWSFTLLHELAHIWLGRTGISGGDFDHQIERFCNDIASEILLPNGEMATLRQFVSDRNDIVDAITAFASQRKLSRPLIAYRLYKSQRISRERWQELKAIFHQEWEAEKARQKTRAAESENGPTYYVVRRHRVGAALVNVVRWAIAEGFLTPTKAGRVLGVRPNNVQALIGGQ